MNSATESIEPGFSWGYIIFYLLVLLVGLVGNTIFCVIVKKNQPLHR